MFKRANKITALLVAAASVMSVVPAMAATKLANKDGHIYDAVAFADGKYLYEGYRADEDDSALYYNDGKADKKLDDATEFSTSFKKFDNKSSMVMDGSTEYVVDLTTGKQSDEDAYTDLNATAETKLRNKLDDTDRYKALLALNTTTLTLVKTDANQFGDVWYEWTMTKADGTIAGFGYTNASGAYVDCSYDVNAYVFSTEAKGTGAQTTGGMVKLEAVGKDAGNLTLDKITFVDTVGQDDKYIYFLADLNVLANTGNTTVKMLDLDDASTVATKQTVRVLQKVAKAQGDDKDDAKLPKSTDSYVVSATYNSGDVKDAKTALDRIDNGTATASIVDGQIFVNWFDASEKKAHVYKLITKNSEKIEAKSTGVKVDAHVVKQDGDTDEDATDMSIDVKGNAWIINEGKIMKSTKAGDFETVYTCDRSMDKLDVYDEKNLIAWEHDSDVYTNVGEGTAAAQAEAATIVQPTPPKIGWDKLADGNWNFYDATGTKQENKWVPVDGSWYYLGANGIMQKGWFQDKDGTWYHLKQSGAMTTGWFQDTDGNWYYLNASGAMQKNTSVDGYKLGASGAWVR